MIAADRLEHKDLIFTYGGTVYPAALCTPEIFKAMESFEAKRDDVILASFPKLRMFFSLHKRGCHNNTDNQNRYKLVWTNIKRLNTTAAKKKKKKKETNHQKDVPEEFPYLEIGYPEKYKKLPPRRLTCTYMAPQNLPQSIFKNKAKMLLLLRNPKDLVIFYYHFSLVFFAFPSDESWDSFFKDFTAGRGIRSSFQSVKKTAKDTHGAFGDVLFCK
ncbi:hypothetical protein QYF61_016953, partial [Mycteria americana]